MILTDLARLNRANFFAFNRALVIPGMGEVYQARGLYWVYTGVPSNNRVFSGPPTERQVERVVERFRAWQVPIAWIVGPDPSRANTERVLKAHGFSFLDRWAGMSLDLARLGKPPEPPQGSTLERVTPQTLPNWAQTIAQATRLPRDRIPVFARVFEHTLANPSLEHFLVRLEGVPVTTFSLFRGKSLGVYYVATVPEARGQGLATAWLWQQLAQQDPMTAVLQATQAGFGVYKRIGFSQDCQFEVYFRSAG